VLGHEIGHVSARHAQRRQNTASLTGLGAMLLGAVSGSSAIGQLAGQGAQFWTLGYSRTQEYQADGLGIDYMAGAGYDPAAAADMLQALEDQSRLESTIRGVPVADMPVWARTHPLTEDRVRRAREIAQAVQDRTGASERRRAAYLAAIDGQLYGDSPAQGYVDGPRFAHPRLRIAFEAPRGYYLQNGTRSVDIMGPNGVQAQFAGGELRAGEDLQGYVSRLASSLLQGASARAGTLQRTNVNGIAAAVLPTQAQTQRGIVDVTFAAYAGEGNNVYHFVTIAPSGSAEADGVERLIRSFRRLSAAEAAKLRPRVIDVVTVKAGDTVESLSRRMAFDDYRVERFRTINDLGPGDRLKPGDSVKLIVYG
jgi:predicted Zn-dependent protease